jgi:hypothetical protein
MTFEEAVILYNEKGKSFLLKSTIKHGYSKAVSKMLFEAIEKELLVVSSQSSVVSQPKTKDLKPKTFFETLTKLRESLPGHYDRAKFLHAERVLTIEQNKELIKKGVPLSDITLAGINANTREIHSIFSKHITPTWEKIDTLTALGKLPDEVDSNELPDDVQSLMKMLLNLRSYISRVKKGATDIKQSLEELESKKSSVELKLASIGKAAN